MAKDLHQLETNKFSLLGGTIIHDFTQSVTFGNIDGASTIDKFGVRVGITTSSDPEDIWEFGGIYPHDADNTAPILYLSSDSNDLQPIEITGLDIEGNEVTQTITLSGSTNVLLTTPLWRVFRMENVGSVDLAGIVYCHTDPSPAAGVPAPENVRAIIKAEHNQTLMAVYTIPKGKVGFLYRGEAGLQVSGNVNTLPEYAHLHYLSRRFGKVFRVKKSFTLIVGGNSTYVDKRSFPDVIPALTDVKLNVVEVTTTMGVWGTFDILLIDEEKFNAEYLKAIGQPEY